MATYIQLGQLGNLTLSDDINIPLNLSVAEIQDISKRQGGYSKTIKIDGNENNNILLGNLFDVNITDATFDINLKTECVIIQDGLPIFSGYFQLLNVIKTSPSLGNPDQIVTYEGIVKDSTGDFFSSLSDKLLEDLSGFEQYNHIYSLTGVTSTSGNTWEDGYKYHMTYNMKPSYNLSDFTPNIFAKQYFDRIFQESGYSYKWDKLEDEFFHKMVIPYNGDTPTANLDIYASRAGFTSGGTVNYTASTNQDFFGVIYNDDSTGLNFDGGNHYDTTTGVWTSDYVGTVSISNAFKYEVGLYAPVACYFKQKFFDGTVFFEYYETILKVNLFNHIYRNNVEIPIENSLFYSNVLMSVGASGPSGPPESAQTYNVSVGYTQLGNYNSPQFNATSFLFPNDTFNVGLETQLEYTVGGTWLDAVTDLPLADADIPRIVLKYGIDPLNQGNNFLTAIPTNQLGKGMMLEMPNFIPKNIKQKDFISGIVKMYNLYITPSQEVDKQLIIESRDDFYDSGISIDWTDKLAIDNDAKLTFLPDLTNKILEFSFKKDKDVYNTVYTQATSETYGQLKYTFGNEFVKDTKLIEPIFSPTPLLRNYFGIVVPAIDSKIPKNNIRILYDGGWFSGDTSIFSGNTDNIVGDTSWTYRDESTFQVFNSYPYMGHLDNPVTPLNDFQYGQPVYLLYDTWDNTTDNNLYNKYYQRYVSQIENGKLLVAKFKLTPSDILNLDFRNKVWIHDSYWFVNKITDYNANKEQLTTVELINVEDGTSFEPVEIARRNFPIKIQGALLNFIHNLGNEATKDERNIFGERTANITVNGFDNIIQAGTINSILVGDGNSLAGKDSMVIGTNNTIEGNNIIAIGVSGQTLNNNDTITLGLPVVATTISADTLFIGGSPTPIEPSPFIPGSSGSFNAKLDTDTPTDATGNYAVAEGAATLASGNASHAEGTLTLASNSNSHAEGQSTTASGVASHAEGNGTTASNASSHAEGISTVASGIGSHAEGNNTTALGLHCHAEGNNTQAGGFASHAGGIESSTRFDGEFASSSEATGLVGQTQYGIVDSSVGTNDATPTLLDFTSTGVLQGGFSPPFAVVGTTSIAMSFRYQMTCFRTSSGAARIITGEGLIKWIAGVPTLVFASTPSNNGDAALAAITATPVASVFGLQFQVTGLAGAVLRWKVRVDYNF